MSKKISALFVSVLCFGFFFPGKPCILLAQPLEMDQQERLDLAKPQVDELRRDVSAPTKQTMHETKEVKFVAGKDNLWFTADDQIYHFFLLEYDNSGRVSKKLCLKAGPDGIPGSGDDELVDYLTFEYSPEGQIVAESSFDAAKAKQYTAVYEYDLKGKKIRVSRVNPKNEEIRAIAYSYNPKGLLIKDVEFVGKAIEKYHRFEYDPAGQMIKAMEYHFKQKGQGADGKWFTKDDVVSSTKQFFYNKDGSKSMEKKYTGSGPDGKWFTKDDELQYYTLFYYQT
jgi:hypothetical protein